MDIQMTHSERRSLGRFDTPRPLAQAITDWAVRTGADRVLEPSVGGGAFASSFVSRLKHLGSLCPEAQIAVCDIDPRALRETENILHHHIGTTVLGDFLSVHPAQFGDLPFDAVVGNPPYVRLHALDSNSRLKARQSLPSNDLLDAKASLWAYFPIHAHKMLCKGGRAAWVLPETILHAAYGRQLLRWAAENYRLCRVLSLRERCFKDAGAKERVVLLLLDGAGVSGTGQVEMTEVGSVANCIVALTGMTGNQEIQLPKLNGHAVTHLLSSEAADAAHALESCPELKRFGSVADVKIGVVTGDNRFFVISEVQRQRAGLRRHHFRPVVGKYAILGGGFEFNTKDTAVDDSFQWLLCPNPSSADQKLLKHLDSYPLADRQANRTMEKRPYWQAPLLGQTADAFLRYMGKTGPRLVLNKAGFLCTNTIHCVYFAPSVTPIQRKAICLAAHSTYTQLSAEIEGRQYGSGVLKLEPSEARNLRVPANEGVLNALGKSWKTIEAAAQRNGWEVVVDQIDQAVIEHCPTLISLLPLDHAKDLLRKLKTRRIGQTTFEVGKVIR